jgi:hypothetical protein
MDIFKIMLKEINIDTLEQHNIYKFSKEGLAMNE